MRVRIFLAFLMSGMIMGAVAQNPVITLTLYEFDITAGSTPVLPTVTTDSVIDIISTNNSAVSGGEVISDGGATVTARGVCWSTVPDPTLEDDHTLDGSGTGTFVSYLTGLNGDTQYYVRAYATNSVGTSYGNQVTFTTLKGPELPTVTKDTATNITQTTATCGGEVTSDGGACVTVRGVCWSTSPNPTTSDDHTEDGCGIGTFVSNLTGLTANTPYYVRAYATNSVGTAYGNEISFKTLSCLPLSIHLAAREDPDNSKDTIFVCVYNTLSIISGYTGPLELLYKWSNGSVAHEITVSTTGVGIDIQKIWLEVTDPQSGCTYSDTLVVFFDYGSCLGIGAKEEPRSLRIYPNPAHDFLSVEYNSDTGPSQLFVINVSGQVVYKESLGNEREGMKQIRLDLRFLPRGLYLVKLISDKELYTGKILLN